MEQIEEELRNLPRQRQNLLDMVNLDLAHVNNVEHADEIHQGPLQQAAPKTGARRSRKKQQNARKKKDRADHQGDFPNEDEGWEDWDPADFEVDE